MHFKKTLLAALAIAATASAHAEVRTLQATVKAIVPTTDGLIVSAVGNWDNAPQTMTWDDVTESLKPLNNEVDIKSPSAVSAYLSDAANLNGSGELVPMAISIGGKALAVGPANKVEVATADEASDKVRKATQISATKPSGGFEPGDYSGVVTLVFENE